MSDRNRVPSAVMTSRLQDDGGFTFSENSQKFAKGGAFASQWGTEQKVAGGATPLSVDQFRTQNAEHLSQKTHHLGGWRHEGSDYLDVSKQFADPAEAAEFGRRNAQIAAFDLDKFEEIPIDYGASKLPQGTPENIRSEYNELGRTAVDAQLHGRADPSQARERGAQIADKLFQQETLQTVGQNYSQPQPQPETLVARVANRIHGR